MSGLVNVEERETMVGELENLTKDWKERKATSMEMRRASDNLSLHRKRINKLVEELSLAEAWDGELEAKRRRIEESLKPPLLGLFDKLEREDTVDDGLLQEAVSSGEDKVLKILEERVGKVMQMNRSSLLQFVDLLLRLRQVLNEEFMVRMEKVAKVVIQELARPDINWYGLDTWEAGVVKKITQRLEGVPLFMARLTIQLLGNMTKKKRVDVGVQTEENSG